MNYTGNWDVLYYTKKKVWTKLGSGPRHFWGVMYFGFRFRLGLGLVLVLVLVLGVGLGLVFSVHLGLGVGLGLSLGLAPNLIQKS